MCVCAGSQLSGRGDEGGAVCVCVRAAFSSTVMLPRTTLLIRADLRAGMQGAHATHTHMTHVVSHAFINSLYEARIASSQLSRTVTFTRLLFLLLVALGKLIQPQKGRIMKVRPTSYPVINHPAH